MASHHGKICRPIENRHRSDAAILQICPGVSAGQENRPSTAVGEISRVLRMHLQRPRGRAGLSRRQPRSACRSGESTRLFEKFAPIHAVLLLIITFAAYAPSEPEPL